jgi:hypothetical protein
LLNKSIAFAIAASDGFKYSRCEYLEFNFTVEVPSLDPDAQTIFKKYLDT